MSVHFVVIVVPKPFCQQSWESIELLAVFISIPELLLRGLLFLSNCRVKKLVSYFQVEGVFYM